MTGGTITTGDTYTKLSLIKRDEHHQHQLTVILDSRGLPVQFVAECCGIAGGEVLTSVGNTHPLPGCKISNAHLAMGKLGKEDPPSIDKLMGLH